ncbi:MAG: DUF5067 domain-containing protein [Weissella confusa]|nr:DUF5067 domain-containing protein [Weissella confusa]
MHKLFKLASVALVSASLAGTAFEAVNIVLDAGTVSAAKKKAKKLTSGKTVKLTDINLKITKWAVIPVGATGNEYGDKPVIAFWYDVKNKTGKDIDPISAWLAAFNAYQDTSKTQVNELDVASALMLDLRTDFSLPCKLIAEEHFLYDSIFTRI